jgi:hypothetical protein
MTDEKLQEINKVSHEIFMIDREIDLLNKLIKQKDDLVLDIRTNTNNDCLTLTSLAYSEEIINILKNNYPSYILI